MARSDLQVNIRMPADLKGKLGDASASSGRSLNAEIVYRLERSFESGKVSRVVLMEPKYHPIRIYDQLQDRLQAKADEIGRPLEMEIAFRLEASLMAQPTVDLASVSTKDLIGELLARQGVERIEIRVRRDAVSDVDESDQ